MTSTVGKPLKALNEVGSRVVPVSEPIEKKGGLEENPRGFEGVRIAIVHDWLAEVGGAEKVLAEMLKIFPDAALFSLLDTIPRSDRGFLAGKPVQTTFLQKIPGVKKIYRHLLLLMPLAVEHLDLSSYELIISSSHAVAKGLITGPDQLHLCYCHSPARYAWDMQELYLRQAGFGRGITGFFARALLHYIRIWDSRTANGVDAFAANSSFVARRIWKVYRRKCRVIHPPVDVMAYSKGGAAETVLPGKTGVLFTKQSVDSLKEAVLSFEKLNFDSQYLRSNAKRFAPAVFRKGLLSWAEAEWKRFNARRVRFI